MGNELSLLQRWIFPLCCNSTNACRCIMFQRSQEASLKKSWELSMDHIENCLQFNWFFAAHLDTFNLFHRARSVIRWVSKNELQRWGLFYKKKGDILIKSHRAVWIRHQCREVWWDSKRFVWVTVSGEPDVTVGSMAMFVFPGLRCVSVFRTTCS